MYIPHLKYNISFIQFLRKLSYRIIIVLSSLLIYIHSIYVATFCYRACKPISMVGVWFCKKGSCPLEHSYLHQWNLIYIDTDKYFGFQYFHEVYTTLKSHVDVP